MNPTAKRMKFVVGDITTLGVDAVVTSANEALCGGHVVSREAVGPGIDGLTCRGAYRGRSRIRGAWRRGRMALVAVEQWRTNSRDDAAATEIFDGHEQFLKWA